MISLFSWVYQLCSMTKGNFIYLQWIHSFTFVLQQQIFHAIMKCGLSVYTFSIAWIFFIFCSFFNNAAVNSVWFVCLMVSASALSPAIFAFNSERPEPEELFDLLDLFDFSEPLEEEWLNTLPSLLSWASWSRRGYQLQTFSFASKYILSTSSIPLAAVSYICIAVKDST